MALIFQDADNQRSCEHSCEFLHKIYLEKPGVCSISRKFEPSNECTAECQFDGDCVEEQKCCTVGCGRKCVKVKHQDIRLLPIPSRISVVERKRKRSAVIRWVMQKMSRNQLLINANLYVIQWRWSVHKDESKMTEWQTIMVKNKLYAIMKHLLSPGRYYQFRVAAVNHYGSRGFSNSSAIFRLSKEARAPGQPTNIVLSDLVQDSNGFWSQKVSWTPPISDLPIKNYVLNWQNSTNEEADSYENSIKRKIDIKQQLEKRSTAVVNDEIDEDDGFLVARRHSIVVPPYITSATIKALASASVFLVEVHAIVESSDGELRGERGIIFVRTPEILDKSDRNFPQTTDSASSTTAFTHNSAPSSVSDIVNTKEIINHLSSLRIYPPYYENGNLKTSINWSKNLLCTDVNNVYIVRWRLTTCQPYLNQEKTYYDLDSSGQDWAVSRTENCYADLDELEFSCYYEVEVRVENADELVAESGFKTSTCQETLSDEKVPCDAERLRCYANSYNARCEWTFIEQKLYNASLIGYRITVTNARTMNANETVLPATVDHIELFNLIPDTVYNVVAQTITKLGLKETLRSSFKTLLTAEGQNVVDLSADAIADNKSSDSINNRSESFDDSIVSDQQHQVINDLTMQTLSVNHAFELPLLEGGSSSIRHAFKSIYLLLVFWLLQLWI
uniref:Fibronectin type-III domain-containing protein n=1 Tax=Syphacia muris TaxID=451379 RepID=A0A0N5AJ39_9BILA